MSILTRLNKRLLLPTTTRHAHKWIHTSAYLRIPVKPEIDPMVNTSNCSTQTIKLGRHRSIGKLKRNKRILSTLPESVLSTNYIRHTAIKPSPNSDIYSSFIPSYVWKELDYSIQAGLAPKGVMAAYNHTDHLILHVPNPGACYFQDHIVHKLAAKNKTNLLVLDSQDFIFLAQHCFHHDAATLLPMLSAIDPDSNVLLALKQANFNLKSNENEDNKGLIGRGKVGDAVEVYKKDEENEEDLIDDEDVENANKLKIKVNSKPVEIDLNEIMNHQHHHHHPISLEEGKDIHQISKSLLTRVSTKYMEMFRQFLSEPDGLTAGDAGKIIYLRDYGNMQDAFTRIMLKSLVMAVEGLKQKGHRLMIVASYCERSESWLSDYHQEEDEEREGESSMTTAISNMRPISILPSLETEDQINQWKSLMKQDEAKRIAEINMKQLLAMTSQKSSLEIKPKEPTSLLKELLNLLDYESISKAIWSPIEVDRRVMIAIGHALNRNKKVVDVNDFKIAHDIVQHTFKLREKNTKDVIEAITPTTVRLTKDGSLDIDYLKKNCNDYERKMISRIVDPSKVQGSFKDVRAPITTIDTLQSLVSLPLKRPDLFNKGILKRNFIPGVLLFGPPGTGKTMLAKAVAKDSGSRMLDIQASDVYDMYVGQGEKNVKAIFSLARKLSPCVIFIDEVDSLMNKRGGDFASNSHREIINQLMVEWDGLSSNNQGVIVMAATNRPYDLDDAVLRRMPRRILVDLPNEEDRIEILKILLRDEDHQVSVKELAKMTEHYSGSDLKNVCVSAALKAVQQEAQSKIPQVLTMEHFREALKMVPPSSNEDMDSLVEIRKWDSKFGDGKKKKKTSIGFSSS